MCAWSVWCRHKTGAARGAKHMGCDTGAGEGWGTALHLRWHDVSPEGGQVQGRLLPCDRLLPLLKRATAWDEGKHVEWRGKGMRGKVSSGGAVLKYSPSLHSASDPTCLNMPQADLFWDLIHHLLPLLVPRCCELVPHPSDVLPPLSLRCPGLSRVPGLLLRGGLAPPCAPRDPASPTPHARRHAATEFG